MININDIIVKPRELIRNSIVNGVDHSSKLDMQNILDNIFSELGKTININSYEIDILITKAITKGIVRGCKESRKIVDDLDDDYISDFLKNIFNEDKIKQHILENVMLELGAIINFEEGSK